MCAVAGAELSEDVVDMGFDCSFADEQRRGDLLVAFSCHEKSKHIKFSVRQLWARHSLRELRSDVRRNTSLTCVNGADRIQ